MHRKLPTGEEEIVGEIADSGKPFERGLAGIGHNRGPPLEPLCHSINETCGLLAVGRNAVYGLIAAGILDSFNLAGRRLVSRASILRAVAEARRQFDLSAERNTKSAELKAAGLTWHAAKKLAKSELKAARLASKGATKARATASTTKPVTKPRTKARGEAVPAESWRNKGRLACLRGRP